MPAVSQAQREYLNAKFGHAWVKKHGFDNTGKLSTRLHPSQGALQKLLAAKSRTKYKRRAMRR